MLLSVESAIAYASIELLTREKFMFAAIALNTAQGVSGEIQAFSDWSPEYYGKIAGLLTALQEWDTRDRLRFVEGLAQQLQAEAPNAAPAPASAN